MQKVVVQYQIVRGCYIDKGLDCNNCKSKESCVEDTEKRKDIEEDDDFI